MRKIETKKAPGAIGPYSQGVNADRLHSMAVPYVKAKGQATALRTLAEEFLTEEEKAITRRARNRRISSKPKNAELMDYKMATAFEALIGYLYLAGEQKRLKEVMAAAVNVIEKPEEKRNEQS